MHFRCSARRRKTTRVATMQFLSASIRIVKALVAFFARPHHWKRQRHAAKLLGDKILRQDRLLGHRSTKTVAIRTPQRRRNSKMGHRVYIFHVDVYNLWLSLFYRYCSEFARFETELCAFAARHFSTPKRKNQNSCHRSIVHDLWFGRMAVVETQRKPSLRCIWRLNHNIFYRRFAISVTIEIRRF